MSEREVRRRFVSAFRAARLPLSAYCKGTVDQTLTYAEPVGRLIRMGEESVEQGLICGKGSELIVNFRRESRP